MLTLVDNTPKLTGSVDLQALEDCVALIEENLDKIAAKPDLDLLSGLVSSIDEIAPVAPALSRILYRAFKARLAEARAEVATARADGRRPLDTDEQALDHIAQLLREANSDDLAADIKHLVRRTGRDT